MGDGDIGEAEINCVADDVGEPLIAPRMKIVGVEAAERTESVSRFRVLVGISRDGDLLRQGLIDGDGSASVGRILVLFDGKVFGYFNGF